MIFKPSFLSEILLDRATSPFSVPNDEDLFLTQENLQLKKEKDRRLLSAQPIWLKTTANSAVPLQKVREEDITPEKGNQEVAPILNFSIAQRGFI